jgi:H+/gluconate symporter-like permease
MSFIGLFIFLIVIIIGLLVYIYYLKKEKKILEDLYLNEKNNLEDENNEEEYVINTSELFDLLGRKNMSCLEEIHENETENETKDE